MRDPFRDTVTLEETILHTTSKISVGVQRYTHTEQGHHTGS